MMKTGRPKKPEGEKFVYTGIRFPPEVWEELVELVPAGQRSRFIQELVKRELRRLRRQQKQEPASEVVDARKEEAK
jgi:hypothetical protein